MHHMCPVLLVYEHNYCLIIIIHFSSGLRRLCRPRLAYSPHDRDDHTCLHMCSTKASSGSLLVICIQMMVPSGMMESLMTTTMPSLITKPSFSRLDSFTFSLFTIWQLAPIREFLSTIAFRTVVFGPAQEQAHEVR